MIEVRIEQLRATLYKPTLAKSLLCLKLSAQNNMKDYNFLLRVIETITEAFCLLNKGSEFSLRDEK